jgi:23S rRNA (cytosine1962-C5)-methyltransferase
MPNDKKPRHRERESSSRGPKKAGRSDAPRGARPFSTARPESPYSSRPKPRTEPAQAEKAERPGKPERVRAYDNRPSGLNTARPSRPFVPAREVASDSRPDRPKTARPKNSENEPSSFTLKGPGAVIARRAADRLRGGHVWVYASDVEQVHVPDETSKLGPTLLSVVDGRGIPLGTALYSAASQIALRMVSTELFTSHDQWLALLQQRLHEAFARRLEFSKEAVDTNATRLVFSEADAVPGLIIDKYNELFIVQLLTQGLDRQDTRDAIVKALREQFNPSTIVERPDPRIRELEQLAAPSLEPLYVRDAEPLIQTQFQMNGLTFHYDASAGQKTGAFLDQSCNYAAAEHYAHGDALDVCTYQGGFALHMARKCAKVTGVDVSRAALEVAERNLEANRAHVKGEVDWIEANAFELLREWSDSGMQFDTIVLDPPAFAKTKRAAENAVRGYKEMTLRALKMLRPGGILVTCSCSHHVSLAEFTQVVATAAVDANRRVQLLERRGAAPDHPHVLSIPETEYLKCLICKVE